MKRNHMIDILKGVCIIFIILDHYTGWGETMRLQLLFPYWITMAVPVLMILSGYVYSLSYERHNILTLKDAYRPKFIIEKFIRYTIPFLIAYLLEFAISAFDNGIWVILSTWIKGLFTGGWGPGSYYYPIMVQFIFVFPVIYFIIKKYDFAGLVLCGILNALYEWMQYVYELSYVTYRLLLLRYILLIAFGCYICIGKTMPKKWLSWICTFVGTGFIWLYNYQGYEPTILIHWTETCFIAALFIMPLTKFLLTSKKMKHITCKPLEFLGKASFNIFLVQMVYFNYVAKFVYKFSQSALILNIINLSICILAGIVFYHIESRITKKLLDYIRNWQFDKFSQRAVTFINNSFTIK